MEMKEQLEYINNYFMERDSLKTSITDPVSIQMVYDLVHNAIEAPIDKIKDTRVFSCYAVYYITICRYDKAVEYAKIGTDKNCQFTMANLADCYNFGYGVDQDYDKAFELYQKSYNMKCKNSDDMHIYAYIICDLAACYQWGHGVDMDQKKAFELYQDAAKLNCKRAHFNIASCYYNGHGVDQDYVKAINILQMCITNYNYSNAIYLLGSCHENGYGVKCDKDKALELYVQAAELHNKKAMTTVADHYFDCGNYELAEKYYDLCDDYMTYREMGSITMLKYAHCSWEQKSYYLAKFLYARLTSEDMDQLAFDRFGALLIDNKEYNAYAKLCNQQLEINIKNVNSELKRLRKHYSDTMQQIVNM